MQLPRYTLGKLETSGKHYQREIKTSPRVLGSCAELKSLNGSKKVTQFLSMSPDYGKKIGVKDVVNLEKKIVSMAREIGKKTMLMTMIAIDTSFQFLESLTPIFSSFTESLLPFFPHNM